VNTIRARVELRTIVLPLARRFETSRSVTTHREILLVRWCDPDVDGWAECAAQPEPIYFAETIASVTGLIESTLLPMLRTVATADMSTARAHEVMRRVPGNPLAKAVLESALLDAELRRGNVRLADYLGGVNTKVPVGVSVGIASSTSELLSWVGEYIDQGYTRIKLKIQPGWDIAPVAAVRREFGDDLRLQVDANQAYRPADESLLRRLDDFNLTLLEQPYDRHELLAHARLGRRLKTALCLDESITDLHSATTAITLGACEVINIKPARVGGYLEARSIHDLCRAHGVDVFCGGVLESGIGRAANLALASLPGFGLPGDISATSRYYHRDIAQSFELDEGCLTVPVGAGSGAIVDTEFIQSITTNLLVL
jgi:O-succinylbenzoate synthase